MCSASYPGNQYELAARGHRQATGIMLLVHIDISGLARVCAFGGLMACPPRLETRIKESDMRASSLVVKACVRCENVSWDWCTNNWQVDRKV